MRFAESCNRKRENQRFNIGQPMLSLPFSFILYICLYLHGKLMKHVCNEKYKSVQLQRRGCHRTIEDQKIGKKL